ncbi:MAG: D-alanyl-D-alanine carboxypeptidase [Armatimonadetes bacterium]|nr:MAG: D-alanyl-D-alanine carboxypeptidase [Armatimonadota bacterium]
MKRQIIVISLVLAGGVFFWGYNFYTSFGKEVGLVSPGIEGGKVANNLWLPKLIFGTAPQVYPEITAKSAYFVDIDTGQVLYEKNPEIKLPIASLTKIMTAIVALENRRMDEKLEVSMRASQMEPDAMFLKAGERLTVEELLYGIFLVSGNDAAEVLAEKVLGDRESFIAQMNAKAKQIGMNDTYLINPSGLQEDDKEQYSTAYDIALMSRYAIRYFPRLTEISSTPHIVLPQSPFHQEYNLYSGINLLTTYPGVKGFKTGYTPEAGLTLVTYAQKDDKRIIGVLLSSQNRREEARELLDYSFAKLDTI